MVRDRVEVDYQDWMGLAVKIIDRPGSVTEVNLSSLRPHGELLPGWYDDWILLERERVRYLQLHMLEVAADQLLRKGRLAAALEFAAYRADPRERASAGYPGPSGRGQRWRSVAPIQAL
jgi:two-component SAPR family response regulator